MTAETTKPQETRPDRNATLGFSRLLLSLALTTTSLAVAGCQHRDATETLTDWWHGYEGGEIAKLRPPAPGQNLPYPHVGRTPDAPPELPSPEARAALTEQLEEQRNLAQRESAANGVLPQPAAKGGEPPRPAPVFDGQTSTTMTTVGQPATPPPGTSPGAAPDAVNPTGPADRPAATPDAPKSAPPAAAPSSKPAVAPKPEPEAPLPPVVLKSIPPTPPGQFPQIGDTPPPPPEFPGFAIPWDAHVAGPVRPDIDAQTPEGTLVRFRPTTDQILGNAQSTFGHIADDRAHRRVVILGFGAAMSADAGLSPADQAREIALGTLRARAVARGLIAQGVPASAIVLRAEPIGDGARVTYMP